MAEGGDKTSKMEFAIRSRRPFQVHVNKLITELTTMCNNPSVELEVFQIKAKMFDDLVLKLEKFDLLVLEAMAKENADTEMQDKEMESIMDSNMKIEATRLALSKKFYAIGEASMTTQPDAVSAQRSFKLPKIELKKFNGDLKQWLGFWSQFEKIDRDDSLHPSDKFQYLIQAMELNSEAREIVLSYPPTGDNYQMAVEALRNRYGDEGLQLQVYVRELLNLVVTNVSAREKIPLVKLYTQLESHLRALKSLNLQKADPATWLYPLVESSLAEDVLLAWQRSPGSQKDGNADNPPKTRLDYLMEFLGVEVQIKQKISLAQRSFDIPLPEKVAECTKKRKWKDDTNVSVPTLNGFHVGDSPKSCIFCGKSHDSKDCFSAQSMSQYELRSILREKNRCYNCLQIWHRGNCRKPMKCIICGDKHVPLTCAERNNKHGKPKPEKKEESPAVTVTESNQVCSSQVILQTLLVEAHGKVNTKTVRAFVDTGSQGSYILKNTAKELELQSVGREEVVHILFGGRKTTKIDHNKYIVKLQRIGGNYSCDLELRDQGEISNLPRVSKCKDLLRELRERKIWYNDAGEDCPPIEILIGADYWGQLLNGEIQRLNSGLVAIGSYLGWTMIGKRKMCIDQGHTATMSVINSAVHDVSVSDLWDLEAIGVKDPVEVQTNAVREAAAKIQLLKTLSQDDTGRYIVGLPWANGHPPLPTNYEVAIGRLNSATSKLFTHKLFESYDKIFQQWKAEGFIEDVPGTNEGTVVHYLPHRPVLKPESLTTPVRPVFDASCKNGKSASLNDCLEKGPSYVALIPDILLRFRERKIGVISDIRKAFQMIEVKPQDRDALRFLWWKDYQTRTVVEYRHVRVVFGATCSPFILGAVLEHHLNNVDNKDKAISSKIRDALFVDNCVLSLDTMDEYKEFRDRATGILNQAQMELRMWMCNEASPDPDTATTSVLGMRWNRKNDTLSVGMKLKPMPDKITKRNILSLVQKIYDPVGFSIPAVIPMKLLLQKSWVNEMSWDNELPLEDAIKFRHWCAEIEELTKLEIPRMATGGETRRERWSLHTFTDASKSAYAAAVFLRVQHQSHISVQLLGAKSRVAPIKEMTIPRLELMGCLIGSRLAFNIKNALSLTDVQEYFWCDSTTALAWIRRDDNWATFVGNRVTEINRLSQKDNWRHVPGVMNPADLPSRGCSTIELLCSKWWEGPEWLKENKHSWPNSEDIPDEDLISAERRKSTPPVIEHTLCALDGIKYERTFEQVTRIWAWIIRYLNILRSNQPSSRENGVKLTHEEICAGRNAILKMIQKESFPDGMVPHLEVNYDQFGILRVKTRITMREDLIDFKWPVVLPSNHPLVRKLIEDTHVKHSHAGVGFLMCKLREEYWIIKSRRTIKSVISSCPRCRRYAAKKLVTAEPPLPVDRIAEADIFENIGVDLAGPLILKNGNKAWICIFTCAVYRAVHLEVLGSLKSRAFIQALKRFIRKNRRPAIIYCDNGTNFVGASNLFARFDWQRIQNEDQVNPIQWKFNPPTASWWGGFWERLIRSMKDILRRIIGKTSLNLNQLEQVIYSVEETMNGRPLTYISEDPGDLSPLTPMMFMRLHGRCHFPEGELCDRDRILSRWKYLQSLKEELRQRFRREYLSQLVMKPRGKVSRSLKKDEVVIIGSDGTKRINWPLGRILELIPGKDGVCRVAKVKTADSIVLRPIQRLFPLELDCEVTNNKLEKEVKTRSGRIVKAPNRF